MSIQVPLPTPARRSIPAYIALGTGLVLAALAGLFLRSRATVNKVALDQTAKSVTTVAVRAAHYRPSRRYVGTVAPWLEARVGPQFTAAYVDTVLARPGDAAQKGQVLATLDCQSASAQSKAMQMQARALGATQEALAKEASRMSGLLTGGYVSPNEVERRTAESASKQAELLAANARLVRATLEVDDCVLRAPFAGEVADRLLDPGAFARPGAPILTLVDRSRVRILCDVPEADFAVVATGTPVRLRLVALGRQTMGVIARRAPAADAATRTIHAEIDLEDPDRRIPVGTTAELTIEIGEPVPAVELPLPAAAVRGDAATVFVVSDGVAHRRKVAVLGESGGSLFVGPELGTATRVVTEGRALLKDGDPVTDRLETWTPPTAQPEKPPESPKSSQSPEAPAAAQSEHQP